MSRMDWRFKKIGLQSPKSKGIALGKSKAGEQARGEVKETFYIKLSLKEEIRPAARLQHMALVGK